MNLPDFLSFEPFNILRNQMGARELGSFVLTNTTVRLTREELDQLASAGIEINIDDITILRDGTLAYKNSRVIVYIRDISYYHRGDEHSEHNLPRFHVLNCQWLQFMRSKNRWGRYVVSTREDGLFVLSMTNRYASGNRQELRKLNICKYCLTKLGYAGYHHNLPGGVKRKIVTEFTIAEYFGKYSRTFTLEPDHTDQTAPLNEYPAEFERISRMVKEYRNWTCAVCSVNLSDPSFRQYLHAHHKDGQKNNNIDENLEALCIRCHSDKFMHSQMKSLPEYQEYISLLANGMIRPR